MRHKATLAPIIPIFGLWRPCMGVNGAKNKDSDVQWFSYIFFIFLKDLFYKLSLGCNTSHYLVIFLWKLIKNSYSAIKNLKKLWLQAKFSNFWMPCKCLCHNGTYLIHVGMMAALFGLRGLHVKPQFLLHQYPFTFTLNHKKCNPPSIPTVQFSNLADFYVYSTLISLSKINLYHWFKLL